MTLFFTPEEPTSFLLIIITYTMSVDEDFEKIKHVKQLTLMI